MLRGLYTAAAGMLATTTSVDTLASNLANVNTVGFKGNKLNFQTFPQMLISKMDGEGQTPVGSIMTGSKVYQSFMNFTAGSIHETGNTFDLAIHGDGFFTVKSAADGKEYYTRAGNFTINAQGFLTTTNGDYVQGKLGNIQVKLDDGPFSITGQGNISGKGRQIDQLLITRFKDNQSLEKVTENLFQATPNSEKLPPAQVVGYKVQQGALEGSNVNPISELVNNIQGMRLYEALQKNIHMHNEALGKAVNDVGKSR
ncbi:MAG: flagellar basal-body rod protein FlgF [Vampirovibrio sp.]|jgi:flagellar basal-body rod protein FlgG|nr:flagellar basal-body rod protein FlgF [Vampirovibrio sp.]